MSSFEESFAAVQDLVDNFQTNQHYYLAPSYSEADVRKDFIDKFLICLGWDVNHERQRNPYEQEVKVERSVRTGLSQRRADYAFFLAPNFRDVKFFVEAKKPARNLDNANDYYQTIRYGWNQGTPVAVLTDFEEFHVIDSRFKPDLSTALDRKIRSFHYSEFSDIEKFAEVYWLFSREAVDDGSLEKFAETLPAPKGRKAQRAVGKGAIQPVDEAFLENLDHYRDALARTFKVKNPHLDGEALTEGVQRTLDRLVFIRFLEDKQIEESMMKAFGKRGSAWKDFLAYSRSLEPKYNGLIFKPHPVIDSSSFNPPDATTFATIVEELSDPASPYNFDQIPVSILGSIYERFLGKVITVTEKRAKVVERPEVVHAGGVYYTPEYIVRYIVSRTVGELLGNPTDDGRTPDEIARMKFADIACGSGSFLIEVYTQLLDYHSRYYAAHPERARKGDTDTREGVIVLSLKKRQDILKNSIHGVDIDFQATEVTQMSLYLKLLEDVTMNDAFQMSLLKEKILPNLSDNIICGNSIVGEDYWGLFDEEGHDPREERRINAMDYRTVFPEVMRKGGFDAIVGNPPYVRQETLGERFKKYAKDHYTVYHGTADLYTYFIERSISLLKKNGRFGIIVANKWMRANYGKPLRSWLKDQRIDAVIDFGDLPVFQNATTYPCILLMRKDKAQATFQAAQLRELDGERLSELIEESTYTVSVEHLDDNGWSLVDDSTQAVLTKIRSVGVPLGEYVEGKIYRGILTGLNEAFVIDAETRERLIAEDPKSAELIKPFLLGRDIKRYQRPPLKQYLILIPKGWTKDKAGQVRNPWHWLESTYPGIAAHLKPFAEKGQKRYDKGEYWWELRACEYYDEFERAKILIPAIVQRASYTLDYDKFYSNDKSAILATEDLYLLGLLNSRTLDFIIHSISSTKQGGFYEYKPMYVSQLPIMVIDYSDPEQKSIHDKIVSLVQQRMQVNDRLQTATTEQDQIRAERAIKGTEREIDDLVYQLYGLTEEEIAIVEGDRP